MSTTKAKVVQEPGKHQGGALRARLRSDAALPQAQPGGGSKAAETDPQLPAEAGVLKVSEVSQLSYNALRSALQARRLWETRSRVPQDSPPRRACQHLLRQVDTQREQVEHGLREVQRDITRLYRSLMENEGIRSDVAAWHESSKAPRGSEAPVPQGLAGLPPKVKNTFHFSVTKLSGGKAAEASEWPRQGSAVQGQARQPGSSLWQEGVRRAQQPGQQVSTEESDPHNQNKVNCDSLVNALCNDNNILKVEQLQRERRHRQAQGGPGSSGAALTAEPSQQLSAAGGLSSPFLAKSRDLCAQGTPHDPIDEKDAQKLFTVDNPANLYIHGQLRKKIYKHVALNYHEAPAQACQTATAVHVQLEGFSEQFLEAQRRGAQQAQNCLPQLRTLPNCFTGDSRRHTRGQGGGLAGRDGSASERGSAYFSFEQLKSGLADIEMLANLGQPYNNGYCHLNPIYDFEPANVEMLMMARLAFSMKKDRILSFMRNVANRNCEVYQRYGQYKKEVFPKFHLQQATRLELTDRELQAQYPQVYRQHYQSTRSKSITDVFNIQFNEFGEIQDIVQKTQLCSFHVQQRAEGISLDNQPVSISFSPDCYMCTNLRSGRRVRNQGEEDEDEMWRYKENFAKITRIKTDIYSNLPICVDVRNENLQEDPVDYELEHKRRQVWSVQDLKTFFAVLSESPKYIWVASSRLPHKTSKEILYFNQAFAGLMRFEAFQAEACQMKQQLKHNKERIPQALAELIERCLEPIYSHLSTSACLLAPEWLNSASGEQPSKANTSRFDSVRLNLQELVEIYSKVSPQRLQREARGSLRGAGQALSPAVRGPTGQEKPASLGLFPMNAARRSSQGCGMPADGVETSEPATLPYFDTIERYSRRIGEYYLTHRQLVDQLSANKREFLLRFFGFNCSRLTCASLLQLSQRDVAKYCNPHSKRECRQGKRLLSEFLAQGDFFSAGGKLGYYYQDRNFLSEVEFEHCEAPLSAQRCEPQPNRDASMDVAQGMQAKRLKTDAEDPVSPPWAPCLVQADSHNPEGVQAGLPPAQTDQSASRLAGGTRLQRAEPAGPRSFTMEYFSRRAAKLQEKQRTARLAEFQRGHEGVEVSGGGRSKLAERLFFSSSQMELDVEGLLQAAHCPLLGQDASAAEPGASGRLEGDAGVGQFKAPRPADVVSGYLWPSRRAQLLAPAQDPYSAPHLASVEAHAQGIAPSGTLPTAAPLASASLAVYQEMGQLGDPFQVAVSDSSQVTGPVNQPTLFGSSIKAQNQWQRDEKEKFIQLLQLHGRNWQVIADELPRRTAQQCRNYFQNYKYKLRLGRYLPSSDELHVQNGGSWSADEDND